jgi:hypothetical protein
MREGHMMETVRCQRSEYMTAAQCRLLRLKAHETNKPSIALAPAFAFELGLRQKDVIGEWLPSDRPGLTDVVNGPQKWLFGLRWEEIDVNLILRHRLSKSIHGAETVMDPKAGIWKAWDLHEYPMVMDELARLCGGIVDRGLLPAAGPLIVNRRTAPPWSESQFRYRWRVLARAAGLPDEIQNRDSRPGAATEADVAGARRRRKSSVPSATARRRRPGFTCATM